MLRLFLVCVPSVVPLQCQICVESLDLFVQLYGAEAGNLALKTLPRGGLYIAGGVAAKIVWALQKNDQFVQNYLAKGRMRDLLDKIPIYLVTHKSIGLVGAQYCCKRAIFNRYGINISQESNSTHISSKL